VNDAKEYSFVLQGLANVDVWLGWGTMPATNRVDRTTFNGCGFDANGTWIVAHSGTQSFDFIQCVDVDCAPTAECNPGTCPPPPFLTWNTSGGWILRCYNAETDTLVMRGDGKTGEQPDQPPFPFTPKVTLRLVRGALHCPNGSVATANEVILTYFFESWISGGQNAGIKYWEYPNLNAPSDLVLSPV
jgi:hypothetical protein